MERQEKRLEIRIKKMPSKTTLEEFLAGMFSSPTVIFNTEKGVFERIREKEVNK